MSKTYVLKPAVVAICPIGKAWQSQVGLVGNNVNLFPHARGENATLRTREIKDGDCPGSQMTVKLVSAIEDEKPPAGKVPKDTDPFPFGSHKEAGRTYGEVDSGYYDWFLGQSWRNRWPQVLAYIAANSTSIDQDLERAGKI